MMKGHIALFSCLWVAATSALAATPPSVDLYELSNKLGKRFPDIPIEAVKPAPVPGLFEVYTNNEIVYSDATGDWLLMGQLLNTATRENVTTKNWNDYHRVDYAALPFDKAIKIVKGDGSRQLALFEDPHCPYCREIEQTLKSVDNVTIHLFLYPLEDLHPGATAMSQRIWCSSDPAQAWVGWMTARTQPDGKDCGTAPIEELRDIGIKYRINSTPTLVFPGGERIPGAINRDTLEKGLAVQAKKG